MVGLFAAQQQTDPPKTDTKKEEKKASPQRETNARPLTPRQQRAKEKKLRQELETPYRKWLNEDVSYIITDEERSAFKRLQTDEEREQFIENFWLRRDPSPDTIENEFKEEHYRRIAYANEHYASGIPGWKTDRGRIYITYGPPDEIEDHSSGGFYERPPEEGGGETSTFPFQQWRYRYIDGIGNNIIIEFVDPTMSGEFRMTMDPSEKDALLYVPGAGLTMMEQLGLSDKTQRFNNTDGTHLGVPFGGSPESMNEFNRLEQFAKLQRPPAIKFKDLEADVTSRISYNILPMKVRTDFFPVTDASVLTNVTVQFDNKDLQFTNKDGYQKAIVHLLGTITSLTRRPIANFEEEVSVTSVNELLKSKQAQKSIYQKTVPLVPGTYRLHVIVKDVIAGNINHYEQPLVVPRLDSEKLSSSSLILADLIEKMPPKSVGMGQFVIGDYKVRPRMDDAFKRDEKMGIYFKLYNFQGDETTHLPSGQVTYEVVKNGSNEKVFPDVTEDVQGIPDVRASQVTVMKLLPLNSFAPGQYTLRVKVTDKNRNQVLTQSAQFTVT
ncbi:MAG TPA: GWxTD domain-containing protein [Candidatus Sulfopaludibacter sp.]|nr:GWxTD domain-containing protein [Candidatus Sulfopaludibacter sp.]